ncbi:hypothetical protein IYY11_13945 [Methylocystis sp. H62]|uniref:hypothetical protein n=1 Tax=Methylocystis sp. H62 TaxID=2785789 RepID=UPI0018C25ACE|nr:hypothetical protein [Methylocystis sp. H62]MBG0794456.1 hypothetical protein [Methylocystis sp. H62]
MFGTFNSPPSSAVKGRSKAGLDAGDDAGVAAAGFGVKHHGKRGGQHGEPTAISSHF